MTPIPMTPIPGERLSRSGQGFTASPVSDGRHLYFTSEVGNVFVVAAEPKLRIAGVLQLPETCMATPAISDGMLLFRTRHHLIAIGEGGRSEGMKLSSQTSAAAEPPPPALKKPDAALIGDWQGTLEVGAVKLRVHFSVEDSGADMKGTMTSLDQGNAKVNLSRIGDQNGTVHLEMGDMAARFEGRWNEAKDELKGEWHQAEKSFPLTLKRGKPLPPPVMLKKADAALVGDWQGVLEVTGMKLRVHFSIKNAGDSMTGSMTSLDQGNAKAELSRLGDHDGAVRLEMDSMSAQFEGRWNETKDELKGDWSQLGMSLPLVLKRQGSASKLR